jgi:hypothetical protein
VPRSADVCRVRARRADRGGRRCRAASHRPATIGAPAGPRAPGRPQVARRRRIDGERGRRPRRRAAAVQAEAAPGRWPGRRRQSVSCCPDGAVTSLPLDRANTRALVHGKDVERGLLRIGSSAIVSTSPEPMVTARLGQRVAPSARAAGIAEQPLRYYDVDTCLSSASTMSTHVFQAPLRCRHMSFKRAAHLRWHLRCRADDPAHAELSRRPPALRRSLYHRDVLDCHCRSRWFDRTIKWSNTP